MKTSHPKYAVHPAVEMTQRSIATLKEKSGRSLQEWVDLGKKQGPKERMALVQWFKGEHGQGTNWAGKLADRVLGRDTGWGDSAEHYLAQAEEYVDGMYAGGKAGLRPLHRIDFGLALGDTRGSGRLIETGGFAKKDRITHRFEITSPADIDGPVKKWLKAAYDRDAK